LEQHASPWAALGHQRDQAGTVDRPGRAKLAEAPGARLVKRAHLTRNSLRSRGEGLPIPRPLPDGLDWPNWKVPHDLWYTGHESYWHPLAEALQAEMDAKAGKAPVNTLLTNPSL
jgi:hypothetical protein